MSAIISIVIFIACILLCIIILLQNPKESGGGVVTGFSSINQFGGVKRTADFLVQSTWILIISIAILSIVSSSFDESKKLSQTSNSENTSKIAPKADEI